MATLSGPKEVRAWIRTGKGAANSGDFDTAERHARTARGWAIAAIVLGLIAIAISLAVRD